MKNIPTNLAKLAPLPLLLLALLGAAPANPKAADLTVGIQTWTLRELNFDQTVEFALKHNVKHLQMIAKHIDPMGPIEETRRKKGILDQKGLICYTFGVAGTSLNHEENRKLFEFAKFMGIKLIIVEPADFKIFDSLEILAKEYDIKVGIHNHGIKSMYGNPLVVRSILKHRDPRIGVCLDAGWVTAAGFDAAKVFKEYEGRVFDIHLKDKLIKKTEGDDVSFDTQIGEGKTNLKGLFAELQKSHWNGVMAIETDSQDFARKPADFVTTAVRFVKEN